MDASEERVKLVKNDTVASKHIQNTFTEILELLSDEDCADAIEYVDWIKAKTIMRHNLSNEKNFPLFIKGVYYVNFGRNIGAELEKDRPMYLTMRFKRIRNSCCYTNFRSGKIYR